MGQHHCGHCDPQPRLAREELSQAPPATSHDPWLLTLYSADRPRSVSRSELQGNWPVTLYRLTEKLEAMGQFQGQDRLAAVRGL